MVANFPGPDEVELLYAVNNAVGGNIIHRQRLNMELDIDYTPGTAVSSMSVLRRGGTTLPLSTAIDAWVALLRPLYNTGDVNFIGANIWRYTPLSYERTFLNSYNVGLAGSGATATSLAHQDTITFKTLEGGEMRIVLLETILTTFGVDNFPFANAPIQAIATFVTGTGNWILGRDTSYPIAVFNHLLGQNEKTFNQRYRN